MADGRLRSAHRWLRKKGVLRWARRVLIAFALVTGLAFFAVAILIERVESELPPTSQLRSYQPAQVTRVLARDGTVLGEVFTERRTVVPLGEIPSEVKLAVLAAEDASFYEHEGLNYLGMLRALAVNLRSTRSRQGGSTITQQVIKNLVLTPERTYGRKFREVILARRLEQELTKDEILELYLNHIYFGHGRYGVEEASRHYFGKGVARLDLAEAAVLAGLIKGPEIYSPRVDPSRSLERKQYVLAQMEHKGFASREQVEAARKEPLVLGAETDTLAEIAPEVVEEVRRVLGKVVGARAETGGYTVHTTIDPELQVAARTAVRKNLDDWAARHGAVAPLTLPRPSGKKGVRVAKEPPPFEGTPATEGHKIYLGQVTGHDDAKGTLAVRVGTVTGTVDVRSTRYNPKGLLPSRFAEVGKVLRVSFVDKPAKPADPATSTKPPRMRLELGPQSALTAIDVRTREVLALVGSYEAVRGGLDRASRAKRQPGSTFKAFVYGYGVQSRKLTPASILETDPNKVASYVVSNYDESEGKAPRRLREALATSVNGAAVWSANQLGPANVAAFATALGIESKLGPDLSLALGAYEVTPRELAAAYASLAAGGVAEQPILITRIVGPGGEEVPLPARPPAHRVMTEAESYVTTSLLTSVVEVGTGKRAKSLGRPVAGKTGTSNAAKDAWFAGYTADVACVVWTGFDDATPLGPGEVGASAALPAFVDFMHKAHAARPVADFPVPAGVVRMRIDPATGLKAREEQEDAIDEVFVAGTEPTETAPEAAPEEPAVAEADAGAPAEPGAVVPVASSVPPF